MPRKTIPTEIKEQVQQIIDRFNQEELRKPEFSNSDLKHLDFTVRYRPRFKGLHVYLDRSDYGRAFQPICRVTYTEDMKDWVFAIYKYSRNAYDPEEWFFPGAEEVDGTIEGAIRAGMEAYPA
jgi:hypothetical protein